MTDRNQLPHLQQALAVIQTLKSKLHRLEDERPQSAPIAIIGMACRFPAGVHTPDQLWDFLRAGGNAVTEAPPDRWDHNRYYDPDPNAPGKIVTRYGAFLESITEFDARFFGISEREAAFTDPQHRIFAELCWEALENAAINPQSVRGSNTGVFVGISSYEFSHRLLRSIEVDAIGPYLAVGSALSAASGRINYLFDLCGPALSFDTACSSSLTAVHAARLSLSARECDMALVGATNVVLLPEAMMCFSKAHMLSPDGRCKTFDQSANGYVRGEGCGAIVLKRLADAQRDGDHIHGLLLGSAVNSDAASSGLTVPSGKAQEEVIRGALAAANVEPDTIDYVETHGTGTPLGDPIEVNALIRTFANSRQIDQPLFIGSVKTNFGHLESASGMIGLMKTVLAMQHEEIPSHLYFNTPNEKISWAKSSIRVTQHCTPWPKANGRPRRAGVSSFGITGANAHIVLGESQDSAATAADKRPSLLPLSAKTPAALATMCARLADHFETNPATSLADASRTLQIGRQSFPFRTAFTGDNTREIIHALRSCASQFANRDTATTGAPNILFAFSSSEPSFAINSSFAYQSEPAFHQKFSECAEVILNEFLLDIRPCTTGQFADIHPTTARFAAVAAEIATTHVWRSWGARPNTMAANGAAVFAAIYAAGMVQLRDVFHLLGVSERIDNELTRKPLSTIRLHHSSIPFTITEDDVRGSEKARPHNAELNAFLQQFDARALRSTPSFENKHHIILRFGIEPAGLVHANGECDQEQTINQIHVYPNGEAPDEKYALLQLAELWTSGVEVDWKNVQHGRTFRRIPLPTYPFERQSFPLPQPRDRAHAGAASESTPSTAMPIGVWQTATWGRIPSFRPIKQKKQHDSKAGATILFADDTVGQCIADRLTQAGKQVIIVIAQGARNEYDGSGCIAINPTSEQDFDQLIRKSLASYSTIDRIVYAWTLNPSSGANSARDKDAVRGYAAIALLIRALRAHANKDETIELVTLTNYAATVTGAETKINWRCAYPSGFPRIDYRSGPCISHRTIDIDSTAPGNLSDDVYYKNLCDELAKESAPPQVALRAGIWWNRFRCLVDMEKQVDSSPPAESLLFMDRSGRALDLAPIILQQINKNATIAIDSRFVADTPATDSPARSDWAVYESEVPALDPGAISAGGYTPASVKAYRPGGEAYRQAMDASIAYITRYLRSGGTPLAKGDTILISRLKFVLGIYPKFERFFRYLLHVLECEGYAEIHGESLSILRELELVQTTKNEDQSALASTLELLDNCSRAYPQAFLQVIDPITILYPDGRSDLLARAIADSANCFELESRKKAAIEICVNLARTTPRRLRILEVGAGVGELTWPLIEALREYTPEYCFTDIGKGFVADARKEAAKRGLTCMRFGTLDIGINPEEQHYQCYSFDIVIALNVVHATPRIDDTLRNLKSLVRPGGYVTLIEAVRSDPWVNMVWGLADGWWVFEDSELRQHSPLMPIEKWVNAIKRVGFDLILCVPDDSDEAAVTDSALFIIRQPLELRNSSRGSTPRIGASVRAVLENLRTSRLDVRIASWPQRNVEALVARAAASDQSHMIYVLPEIPLSRVQGGLSPLQIDACQNWLRELADELNALRDAAEIHSLESVLLVSYSDAFDDPELQMLFAASRALAEAFVSAHHSQHTPQWRIAHVDPPSDPHGAPFIEAAGRLLARALYHDAPECIFIDAEHVHIGPLDPDGDVNCRGVSQGKPGARPSLPQADRPSNEFERRVCAIWEDVLGTVPIGIHDSFLDVGGDSITATQISSRITTEFMIEIDPKDFLESPPTVSSLSQLVIQRLEIQMEQSGVQLAD